MKLKITNRNIGALLTGLALLLTPSVVAADLIGTEVFPFSDGSGSAATLSVDIKSTAEGEYEHYYTLVNDPGSSWMFYEISMGWVRPPGLDSAGVMPDIIDDDYNNDDYDVGISVENKPEWETTRISFSALLLADQTLATFGLSYYPIETGVVQQDITLAYFGGVASDTITFEYPPTPVPDPETLLLLGVGIFSLGIFCRKKSEP